MIAPNFRRLLIYLFIDLLSEFLSIIQLPCRVGDGRLDGHEIWFLYRKPKNSTSEVNNREGTRLVLQRLLCLFDLFLSLCDHASSFGLVGACIVQRIVLCLLLFAQPSNGSCKGRDFVRILLKVLLYAEQLVEQTAEYKVILRI